MPETTVLIRRPVALDCASVSVLLGEVAENSGGRHHRRQRSTSSDDRHRRSKCSARRSGEGGEPSGQVHIDVLGEVVVADSQDAVSHSVVTRGKHILSYSK